MSQFFLGLQKVLPQHGLSRLVGWLAGSQIPLIRRAFIHSFARAYDISLADAERKHLTITVASTTSLPAASPLAHGPCLSNPTDWPVLSTAQSVK